MQRRWFVSQVDNWSDTFVLGGAAIVVARIFYKYYYGKKIKTVKCSKFWPQLFKSWMALSTG